MECWTDNNSETSKKCLDDRSKGSDKQTDDFLESFPNFMTLTEEERHEFFQTLYAAKINLEKNGVTVRPYFGTIHDQSWNNSNFLDVKNQESARSDVSAESGVGTLPLQSNIPSFKSNISISRLNPVPRNTIIRESLEKNLKEDKTCTALYQENLEPDSETDKSEKKLKSEERKIGAKTLCEVYKNNALNSLESTSLAPALSYEVLTRHEKQQKSLVSRRAKEEMLKIKGTKLKVQVTLTSGDNERIQKPIPNTRTLQIDDWVLSDAGKNSDQTSWPFSPKEGDNFKSQGAKFSREKINAPEIKDHLNVEEENEEEELEKKSSEDITSETKEEESGSQKDFLSKDEDEKKENNILSDVFPRRDKERLKDATFEDIKNRTFERKVPKVHVEEEINEKERNRDKTQMSKSDSSLFIESLPRVKKIEETEKKQENKEQNILTVTPVQQEVKSNGILEKQRAEVASKTWHRKNLERQQRVEKLKKYLQKDALYNHRLRLKNANNKSLDSKGKIFTKEELTNMENSETISKVPQPAKNEETDTSNTSEKTTTAVHCSEEETICKKGSELALPAFEDCTPPFRPGKVVFVDDNVIEKIRNVVLDLDKTAKGCNSDAEKEYLILILEYMEYLSFVMTTLLEKRVLNATSTIPNVRFDEGNLAKIQEHLREQASDSEDECQLEEELTTRKKLKRSKFRKGSFLRRLKYFLNCGKRKKNGKKLQAPALMSRP